jgi:hypothetical protein
MKLNPQSSRRVAGLRNIREDMRSAPVSLDFVNTVYLALFVIGLLTALTILFYRVVEYRRAKWQTPWLLKRDLALIGGLAVPFLLIFIRRAFKIEAIDSIAWTIFTGTPAIWAIWYWVYQEWKLGGGNARILRTAVRRWFDFLRRP